MTNRSRVMDAIELIVNDIAIVSHCQELINDLVSESYTASLEEVSKLTKELATYMEIKDSSLKSRRDNMRKLKDIFDGNDKAWCLFKHAVAAYGYATEIADADGKFTEAQQIAYANMIRVTSLFLNIDSITDCGRCLFDQLLNDNKEE